MWDRVARLNHRRARQDLFTKLWAVIAALTLLCAGPLLASDTSGSEGISTPSASLVPGSIPRNLFGMGDGSNGKLGVTASGADNPTPLFLDLGSVRQVATGDEFSLYVDEDGALYHMGADDNGQRGDGVGDSTSATPVQVVGGGVVAIAAGADFSLYIDSDGALWAFGDNANGQLGDGSLTDRYAPVMVVPSGVVAVAAGRFHTLFIDENGALWTMGLNDSGQLGDGSGTNSSSPVQIISSGVKAIAAGENHSLFVDDDGALWAFGENEFGQLGLGTTTDSLEPVVVPGAVGVSKIAAGFHHSVFVTEGGALRAMGDNSSGQFGNNSTSSSLFPIPVSVPASGVAAIAAGDRSTYIINSDGYLMSTGDNASGQLGDGTTTSRQTFQDIIVSGGPVSGVAAFGRHVLVIDGLGGSAAGGNGDGSPLVAPLAQKFWGMGYSAGGSLGTVAASEPYQPSPLKLGNWDVVDMVSSPTGSHTLFIDSDGALWGMGENSQGQLGLGHQVSPAEPTMIHPSGVVAIAVGDDFSLFLDDTGRLRGMGNNSGGQLGDGSFTPPHTSPIDIADNVRIIAAGSSHALFTNIFGNLYGMGRNDFGQLGQGAGALGSMYHTPVLMQTGIVESVAAGDGHTLWVDHAGNLSGAGRNDFGQLGQGHITLEPSPVTIATDVSTVFAGNQRSFYITTVGELYGFGENANGELGAGDTTQYNTSPRLIGANFVSVATGGTHSLFLDDSGRLFSVGVNSQGQLGNGGTTTSATLYEHTGLPMPVTRIAAGDNYSLFLMDYADYRVTATSGANGIILPDGVTVLPSGDGLTYSFEPDLNYRVADVLVDGVSQGALEEYTFVNVTDDHTIHVTFELDVLFVTITATAGEFGSIDPEGEVAVEAAADQIFTFTPEAGYQVADVIVDDVSVGSVESYAFEAVTADHTIHVNFEPVPYTITATAGEFGSINPAGAVVVEGGASQAFIFTPEAGYLVADVIVDDVSVGQVDDYTFEGVTADHTIVVSFEPEPHTITATAGEFGTIDPEGEVVVPDMANQTFTITPEAGYAIVDVLVDGVSVGDVDSYTFEQVTSDHTIDVTFALPAGDLYGMGSRTASRMGTGFAWSGPVIYEPFDLGHASNVVKVAAGNTHSLYLDDTGALYGLGSSDRGQLGIDGGHYGSPQLIRASGVIDMAAGDSFSLFVESDGSLWAMGLNDFGQLGNGSNTDQVTPVQIESGGVVACDAGLEFSVYLKDDGTVWAMGSNGFGQLGDTTTNNSNTPVQTQLPVPVSRIKAGLLLAYHLTDDGALYGCGRGYYGTFGNGSPANLITPELLFASGVLDVAPGFSHSLFLMTGGELRTSGQNLRGELGIGGPGSRLTPETIVASGVKLIAAGQYTSHFVTEDGVLYSMGWNLNGQLGVGNNYGSTVLIFEPVRAVNQTYGVIAIDAGVGHTLMIMGDETVPPADPVEIIATSTTGGSISPTGTVSVAYGADQAFAIAPAPGYVTTDVTVDGVSQGVITEYLFTSAIFDHTIHASFAADTFTINASAGAGGTISPAGEVPVGGANDQAFTVTPDPGYQVADVIVDSVSQGALPGYTFTNVTADHSISVTFELATVTITATAGPNGSIAPAGETVKPAGQDQTYYFMPEPSYRVQDVVVDGVSQGALDDYTFTGLAADHTIHVTFEPDTFLITPQKTGPGDGTLTPGTPTEVNRGDTLKVYVIPDGQSQLTDVLVDGAPIGATLVYTFRNVQASHTITGVFDVKVRYFTVTANAGAGGSIDPAGAVQVPEGGDQIFDITPAPGYRIRRVNVDGADQGAISQLTLQNVTHDTQVEAEFVADTVPVYMTIIKGNKGSVTPSDAAVQQVPRGTPFQWTITPTPGKTIHYVKLNGVTVVSKSSDPYILEIPNPQGGDQVVVRFR